MGFCVDYSIYNVCMYKSLVSFGDILLFYLLFLLVGIAIIHYIMALPIPKGGGFVLVKRYDL